ncbi:gamma-glutamyltranspeptidase family protein, partial [Vibrio parahaemolyticus V-223/04]
PPLPQPQHCFWTTKANRCNFMMRLWADDLSRRRAPSNCCGIPTKNTASWNGKRSFSQ